MMEEFIIPRKSVFLSDIEIWTDLTRFCAMTGFIPQHTDITKIQAQIKLQQARASKLSRFFGSFRTSSRDGYESLTSSEVSDTLFDKNVHQDWAHQKDAMAMLITKHQKLMTNLQECQKKCWTSKAKLIKYKVIVATQEMYVSNNKEREIALRSEMKKMANKYQEVQKSHDKDYEAYQKKLLEEINCREQLQKISTTLHTDIVDKMAAAIYRLMNGTKQNITLEECLRLGKQILKMTGRIYSSKVPTVRPCESNLHKIGPTKNEDDTHRRKEFY